MGKKERGFFWEEHHFFRRFPGFAHLSFSWVAGKWRLHISKAFIEDKN
jgi:hypothetical protein